MMNFEQDIFSQEYINQSLDESDHMQMDQNIEFPEINFDQNIEISFDHCPPSKNMNDTNKSNQKLKEKAIIKRPKNPPPLNNYGKFFHDKFYAIIKNKKRNNVIKPCVILYHDIARDFDNSIRQITREERRSINIYFNNHANEMNRILVAIEKGQALGKINYPADHARFTNTSLEE